MMKLAPQTVIISSIKLNILKLELQLFTLALHFSFLESSSTFTNQ